MKKIFILLLLLVIGCKDQNYNFDKNDILGFEGLVAYFANNLETKENQPPEPEVEKCNCDSDKMVKSGDGLIRVPCPCGKNCKCHQDNTGSVMKEMRQVIYIGHDASCLPCRTTKKDVFPKLTSMTPPWKISEDEDASIRITEFKEDNEFEIAGMPAYILMVNGQEVSRHEGYLNHIQLSKFYYSGEPHTSKPKPKGSGDDCAN